MCVCVRLSLRMESAASRTFDGSTKSETQVKNQEKQQQQFSANLRQTQYLQIQLFSKNNSWMEFIEGQQILATSMDIFKKHLHK